MAEKEENDAMNGDVEEDVAEVCTLQLVLVGINTNESTVIFTCFTPTIVAKRTLEAVHEEIEFECVRLPFHVPYPIASVV